MQRVKFSIESPERNPGATLYILKASDLGVLPANCYTLYCLDSLTDSKTIEQLPADSLVVSYSKQQNIALFTPKSNLEQQIQVNLNQLTNWLKTNSVDISDVMTNIEKSNEALDTLLSSSSVQSEFLILTQKFLHSVQLSQPVQLSPTTSSVVTTLKMLEQQIRVLSPAFLSDHIKDSQNDDSFLLRDPATGKALRLNSLKKYIYNQRDAGRNNLAKALEQQTGYIRI